MFKELLESFLPQACYEIVHRDIGSKLTIWLPITQSIDAYLKENMFEPQNYRVTKCK